MERQEVMQMIQSEIAKSNSGSRFGFNMTSTHTHDGIQTPFVFNPVATYAGIIQLSSVILTAPVGWSLVKTSTGACQLTHNLDEFEQLVWVASPIGAGGASIPVPIIVPGQNLIEFDWFDVSVAGGGAPIDTTFYFVGVQVNNKNNPLKYYVAP